MIRADAVVAAEKVLTEETVRPGLIGGLFFVLLAVATYFLWRSMNKQLRKVDEHFAEPGATDQGPEPGSSTTSSQVDGQHPGGPTAEGSAPDAR